MPFVNRCAHRGTLVVRELRGNHKDHTCVYHRWCYDLEGDLIGVPYQRGTEGKGGLPPDFNKGAHGLRKLEVATYKGAIFGSFDADVEPLADYLGEALFGPLDRFFSKPVEVMGYMRQRVDANWKAYFENLNDGIHAGLLHQQAVMMGLWGNTPKGGDHSRQIRPPLALLHRLSRRRRLRDRVLRQQAGTCRRRVHSVGG